MPSPSTPKCGSAVPSNKLPQSDRLPVNAWMSVRILNYRAASVICTPDLQASDNRLTRDTQWLSAGKLRSESKEKGSPRIIGWRSLRHSILSGSACCRVQRAHARPPTRGLIQPGNKEMISLSGAAVGSTGHHDAWLCVSRPQGKSPVQWIPTKLHRCQLQLLSQENDITHTYFGMLHDRFQSKFSLNSDFSS